MSGPIVLRKDRSKEKICQVCKESKSGDSYISSKEWIFPDGFIGICNDCTKEHLVAADFSWDEVEKLCMMINIPFIPNEFERLREINGNDVFPVYAQIFQDADFEGLGWKDYYERFLELQNQKIIEKELPELREARIKKLQQEWGGNYDEESLDYLQELFEGMMNTQHINGALQIDQAKKLCKISLSIDERIRNGEDFDKIMTSYNKMIQTAEFTPKNIKNENDFDSIGEIFAWLERRGWQNEYHDGTSRDVVDEVISNLQSFTQKLYVNESNLGELVTERIESLKSVNALESGEKRRDENLYETVYERDLDQYSQDGYEDLVYEETEFEIDDDEAGDLARRV